MKSVAFSDRFLRSLKMQPGRVEITDAACPGLRIRIGARSKVFYQARYAGGRFKQHRLGEYPAMSLREAREAAGEDVDADPAEGRTVRELFDHKLSQLFADGSTQLGSYTTYLRRGEHAAEKEFGANTPATDVTPEMVADWLRKIHRAGIDTRLPRAYLSATFSAGIKSDFDPLCERTTRFGLKANPVTPVGGKTPTQARDRVLTLEEIRDVWHHFCGPGVSPTISAALRAIIATGGQRVSEITNIRREDLFIKDDEAWLRFGRTKNGREHVIPLPTDAALLFDSLRLLHRGREHLFPHRREADAPIELTSLSQALRRWFAADDKRVAFQPRDLRRSMKTLILGHDESLRDAMKIWQNHGRVADVADEHYDWCEYPQTKRRVRDAIDELLARV